MSNDSNDLAILDNFLEIAFDRFPPKIILPLLRSLGESLLLALVPDHIVR